VTASDSAVAVTHQLLSRRVRLGSNELLKAPSDGAVAGPVLKSILPHKVMTLFTVMKSKQKIKDETTW
jgi:hypothetical protein